jgi:integrase/recombinase XerD
MFRLYLGYFVFLLCKLLCNFLVSPMKKATVSLLLDDRISKKDGTFPLKIRITYNRKYRRYGVGISVTLPEWEQLCQPKPKGKLSAAQQATETLRVRTDVFRNKALSILDKMADPFSFESFEEAWFENTPAPVISPSLTPYQLFEAYIQKLTLDKRVKTARSYADTLKSFRHFRKKLSFVDITPDFLKKYEEWMLSRGRSLTTTGIYMRNLRSVCNQSLTRKIMTPEQYPFNSRQGGYLIPKGSSVKKALSEADFKILLAYQPQKGSAEDKALDFFLLSYLCNGVNFKDICRWRYKNMTGDHLTFLRSKTERTTRHNPAPIKVFLSEKAKTIIRKWANPSAQPDNYLFPVLQPEMTPEKQQDAINQFIKTTNKYLRRIGTQTGIQDKLTTYTARHTFATKLKRKGASTEFIKESLGHQNIQTTETYLDSFDDETRIKWAAALLD